MKLAIVSDAWEPQVSGVVRTLRTTRDCLTSLGHSVTIIGPDRFRTIPCPTYPQIRLAMFAGGPLRETLDAIGPDALHVATEGPLGWAARGWARRRRRPFTTSFHTQFPDYFRVRFGIPRRWSYAYLRRFHGAAACTMVATASIEQQLRDRGFRHLVRWSRGVDTALFRPRREPFLDLPRPIMAYVGRVAVEKNIEAFLQLDRPGTKLVVGDGPQRAALEARYPQAVFVGEHHGEDLARHYAASDVFVFPSRTDTFGLVMLEALASGVPVAAYPVPGPIDVLTDQVGCLDEDLGRAVDRALALAPDDCRVFAEARSWESVSQQFLSNLSTMGLAA